MIWLGAFTVAVRLAVSPRNSARSPKELRGPRIES